MKKSLLLLVVLLCSIGQGVAQTLINGIYYELDSSSRTAIVSEVPSGVPKYSGSISIPNMVVYGGMTYSVTIIESGAFYKCSGLTSIVIPNSVKIIGPSAFMDCNGLTSIELPNSITCIYEYAFYNCSGLTSIEIPNSVTSIEEGTFYGCTGLSSLSIGNSVTSIGNYAFYNCSGLTSIEIPNSVTSIGDSAFYGCSGLTSIVIPNSVTSIGEDSFWSCIGLTSIEIPKSVASIGQAAFGNCTGLTSIVVDAGNTHYDSRNNSNAIIETATNTLIAGCKNTVIPNTVTRIGDSAFAGCATRSFTSIEIPNSVTSIGVNAFFYCVYLTSIEIPNSVTSIGDWAFNSCWSLTSIVVDVENTHYDSRNNSNAIIETATNTLIAGCKNTVIPNTVTEIGDYAFWSCIGLTSIEIPNSVMGIGSHAFWQCTGLTDIKMMFATPPTTGENLFADCTNLTTIYVPKGAKEAYNVEPWNSYEIVEMDDTGIAAAPTVDNRKANAPVYNLNGRRVGTANAISTLPKGVYIVNGKKILR